jgi:hypothetical protein
LLHADEISAQIRRLGLSNPVFSLLQDSNPDLRSEVRSTLHSEVRRS